MKRWLKYNVVEISIVVVVLILTGLISVSVYRLNAHAKANLKCTQEINL